MSYYTKVDLVLPARRGDRPAGIEACLDNLGIHHDVIRDLDAMFASGKGSLKLSPAHVDEIMKWISQQKPNVRYVVRARGEDEDTAWTHEYRGGTSTVSDYKPPVKGAPRMSKTARAAVAAIGEAIPYTPQTTYAVGDAIEHPSLGKGLVSQAQPTKITVQFSDAERTLVHGRAS